MPWAAGKDSGEEVVVKVFRYLALLSILLIPAAYSRAQVSVGVGVGPVYGPPVCAYGYYGYAPYACAPYGYYGPAWFNGGVFIGAGPWLRGGYGYYGRGYGYGYRGVYGYGYGYRGGYGSGRGAVANGGGYRGGYRGGGGIRGGRR